MFGNTYEDISVQCASQAFLLAQRMHAGIINLSVSDYSTAEHNFQIAKDIISKLSGVVIAADFAGKCVKSMDQIIRLIMVDSRSAVILARDLLILIERSFLQTA